MQSWYARDKLHCSWIYYRGIEQGHNQRRWLEEMCVEQEPLLGQPFTLADWRDFYVHLDLQGELNQVTPDNLQAFVSFYVRGYYFGFGIITSDKKQEVIHAK